MNDDKKNEMSIMMEWFTVYEIIMILGFIMWHLDAGQSQGSTHEESPWLYNMESLLLLYCTLTQGVR